MGRQPEPRIRRYKFWPVMFRFFAGRPLDGVRRTDSIFLKRGRNSMDPSGWAFGWSYLAGWERLVIRLCGLYVAAWTFLLLAAWAMRRASARAGVGGPEWADRTTPGRILAMHLLWLVLIGGVPATWWGVRYWGATFKVPDLSVKVSRKGGALGVRVQFDGWVPVTIDGRRVWDRTYVRPVAAAAQQVLGTTYHPKESRKWVQVPRTFRDVNGKPVVLALPSSFTGSDEGTKRRLVSAVGNRLGLRDPVARWDLEGDHPRVLISAPPLPPSRVLFTDIREALENAPEYEVVLGMAARREVLTAHLIGDSPHIGLSAGSGAGKSEMIKVLIMQALRWGWGVIVIDWKEVSQQWCEDLPGVLYVRDIEDIHEMGVRLGDEVDARKRLYRQDKSMPGKAKVLIVCEEMNITAPLLAEYWSALRSTAEPEERRTMPLRSPAIAGYQKVVGAGRQFELFELLSAQKFSNRVTNGNTDIRESFGSRLLARATVQTWKMLAPQIKPIPKMTQDPGRWCVVVGQQAVQYQAPLITDEEAREFALGGQENPSSPLTGTHRPTMPSGTVIDIELDDPLGDRLALPNQRDAEELPTVDARKLSEMVDALTPLGITLNVLQHATKDPESGFPGAFGGSPNRGYTYDFQQVKEWARKRHAARRAEEEK